MCTITRIYSICTNDICIYCIFCLDFNSLVVPKQKWCYSIQLYPMFNWSIRFCFCFLPPTIYKRFHVFVVFILLNVTRHLKCMPWNKVSNFQHFKEQQKCIQLRNFFKENKFFFENLMHVFLDFGFQLLVLFHCPLHLGSYL